MSKQFENAEGMPQQILDLVNEPHLLSGGLFSRKRAEPQAEYKILDVRWGSAQFCNMKELEEKGPSKTVYHPTFELLVKRAGMKRARWTNPFPVRQISIINGKEFKTEDLKKEGKS